MNDKTVSAERLALQTIKDRLQSAFGGGVWDMPQPNSNGATRWEHQQAALFSIIEICDKAFAPRTSPVEPGEWQVEAGAEALRKMYHGGNAEDEPFHLMAKTVLRAASIPTQPGVEVKPLEWGERRSIHGVNWAWDAKTSIDWYVVATASGEGCKGTHYWFVAGDTIKGWANSEAEAKAAAQADYEQRIRSALTSASTNGGEAVAWACTTCNSPRSVDPCPKCGTALTKPADGWEWPGLPDIARIRELAREVGYAIGVHGSMEHDLDLIAAPWVAEAVGPLELAEHIARGLGGEVVDFERQDKPCGRWSCNIHTPDWTKMIDLSVMPPISNQLRGGSVDWQAVQIAAGNYPKFYSDEELK